jgi:trehalose/maltose hydrolase-like predicted phosphorylase/hydroxymethylpyrimidine pyrophosphatase-like HAD family hydrolase
MGRRTIQNLFGMLRNKRQDFPGQVERPFRAIIFDWDGTAVVDRREDGTALARLAEGLVQKNVWLAVVTGTNYGTINRQFCTLVAPGLRHHLLICTNRGSEVYGFDGIGQTVRRYLRVATPEENRALTAVAEGVATYLQENNHLEVRLVYDRLNRRKIDLIPKPRWQDPPKAQIAALLQAVQERLRAAHVAGGIHSVIQLAAQLAREQHLDARITSDVKHVEVGLTDKADAVAWLKDELLRPIGIAWRDVLIAGDEFGPIAGFAGSDDRLRVGGTDAPLVSVGVEPNGVPPGVIALGGGPERFRALLARQIALHQQAPQTSGEQALQARREAIAMALATTPDPAWSLLFEGIDESTEEAAESRLAVANGLLGARGALEMPAPHSLPRFLVAGLFARADDPQHLPVLASAPDWTRLRITVDGIEMIPGACRVTRILDLGRGVLLAFWRCTTTTGTTLTFRTLRSTSQDNRALAWHAARLDVDRPAAVVIESWLEPLDPLLMPDPAKTTFDLWRTVDGAHMLALATATELTVPGGPIAPSPDGQQSAMRWEWQAHPDQPALFSRLVAMARGAGGELIGVATHVALRDALAMDLGTLFDAHDHAWQTRWQRADITIEGGKPIQIDLRVAIYHLISAANPNDARVSVGARGLTGDAYHGHVFWDTEIFLLPFYALCWPEAARTLLAYRSRTLPAARAKAANMGYRGALYAWESADTGVDATPDTIVDPTGKVVPVLTGREQQHISADVAYAVWQYWMATQDEDFLLTAGAEIVLETARFWASRATREDDGQYHIRGVIGPDEYHVHVDDNAYTNGMARWNLECGVGAAQLLASRWPGRWAELSTQLALASDELVQWRAVAAGLAFRRDPETGLIEQFDGYFDLEQLDLATYADPTLPMDIVLGPGRTQHAQVTKQADVVMLLELLWDRFDEATIKANFDYYEPRTGHGSSLDPAIQALVAARLGEADRARRYFELASAIDSMDSAGNESLGVHIATLAGMWQAVIFGFGGVHFSAEGIRLAPHLPSDWSSVRFPLSWRGSQLFIAIDRDPRTVAVTVTGAPVVLLLGTQTEQLAPGLTYHFTWNDAGQQWRPATGLEAAS